MTNLLLTILCSTLIALILKFNHTRKGNELVLLMGNYFVASIITILLILFNNDFHFSYQSLLLGLITGSSFVYSFFAFAKAVSSSGTPLASLSSRLSVVIPVVLSIIIFSETPLLFDYIGFFLTLITVVLFYFSLRSDKSKKLEFIDYFYLFILLAGIGINDFIMKIFQHWRPAEEKSFFLFVIFTSAFIYTLSIILLKKIKVNIKDFFRGNILGIPNIFSSFFLIGALNAYPAILVYPITNIGIILLTTLLAMMIWKEKLDKFGYLALLTGLIAILLLNL